MPGLVWKSVGGKKRLVMRWKKREKGKLKIVKEIYIGDMDSLASMIENPMAGSEIAALDFGTTASAILVEKDLGLKEIVDGIIGHRERGMSPGDYFLLFIMNRLSDPRSKSGIERWMPGDYASTLYERKGSQDFWNLMDRITDEHMDSIMGSVREKVLNMGYDFSRIFVDASNVCTYMEENGMARNGHNKAHRYDLNQVSHYIAANYDYIPLFWNSYAGNVHDSRAFPEMIRQMPGDATVIFDRGYNSADNVKLLGDRRYIGSLVMSDHADLADLHAGIDSFTETAKIVYGKKHRIVVYHSSRLEKKRIMKFMRRFRTAYAHVRDLIGSGDSDAMERARFYLESRNMNETILLPDLRIDHERMAKRLKLLGLNALFTSITDMSAREIMELYRRRNRVEHCFRTINTMDMAFPVYHWTAQKIRVHMFMSLLVYLFLALMRMRIRPVMDLYLPTVIEVLSSIRIVYIARGKNVSTALTTPDERAKTIMEAMNLRQIL